MLVFNPIFGLIIEDLYDSKKVEMSILKLINITFGPDALLTIVYENSLKQYLPQMSRVQIIYSPNKDIISKSIHTSEYLIYLENSTSLSYVLEKLKLTILWNRNNSPSAKYLVIVTNETNLGKVLYKFHILIGFQSKKIN